MTRRRRRRQCWLIVVVFAIGMPWVEAASVYYLRVMTNRIDPYQVHPLPLRGLLGHVELLREGATIVMLVTIGMLAARTWRKPVLFLLPLPWWGPVLAPVCVALLMII